MTEPLHLSGYLDSSAERFPDHPAFRMPDGRSITYRQLDEQSARLAGCFRERGVAPGDRVGLLLPKGIEAVVAIFATLRAGAAYVPVDWTGPPARAREILGDCEIAALILDPRCAAVLEGWDADSGPGLVVLAEAPAADVAGKGLQSALAWTRALSADPMPRDALERESSDLAYILYTSGSTGVPKGVPLTHENATSFVEWCARVFELRHEDRFTSHAPFHFDLSIFDLYVAVKYGATVHLIPDDLGKNPRELARMASEAEISVWYSTPSTLSLLAQFGALDRLDYRGPRLVLFAGEVFPVKPLRRIVELWPNASWYNLYGPTETNVCTCAHVPVPIPPDRTNPYPIGEPCDHCQTLVLDEAGKPVSVGEEGRLFVAGAPVFQGYWRRPELNASVFRTVDGVPYYDTGDVVRLDPAEGLIYIGRRDRMVKRRGYRVELGEIESVLYQHSALTQVAAVAVPDENQGVRVEAFVVAERAAPSIVELKVFCSENLPGYMVPDGFQFLEELPTTSTGKTDYQGLLSSLRG